MNHIYIYIYTRMYHIDIAQMYSLTCLLIDVIIITINVRSIAYSLTCLLIDVVIITIIISIRY